MMSGLQPGWLEQQLETAGKEIAAWPLWMKRAAGVEPPWDYKRKLTLPGEVIYEIITEEDGLGFGIAIAEISESRAHFHRHAKEFYFLLEGSISVEIMNIWGARDPVASAENSVVILHAYNRMLYIPPGHPHQAKKIGENPGKVLVFTTPAWSSKDHHLLGETPP